MAVEEAAGHFPEIGSANANNSSIFARRDVENPQRPLFVDQALVAPDGSYEHLVIPLCWLPNTGNIVRFGRRFHPADSIFAMRFSHEACRDAVRID